MSEMVQETIARIVRALEMNQAARMAIDARLSKVERELDSHCEAVVDSLCEISDRLAPLEAHIRGKGKA